MTHAQTTSGGERGFTLLEAIVALTLLGLALVPMLSFISQSTDQLNRVAESNERSFAMQSAIAVLSPVNPMEEPEGEESLGQNLLLRWNSDVIIEPNQGPQVGMGLPGFRVGFYNVHVSLFRDTNTPWFDFDMRKVGYRKIDVDPLFGTRPSP